MRKFHFLGHFHPGRTLCLLALLVIPVTGVAALELTPEEQAYLEAKQPVMCVDPDWWPFEMLDAHDRHVGIAADLHELLRQRLGLKVRLYTNPNWDEQLRASKAGRCQIISFVNQTAQRDDWLIFTEPLLRDPNVLITREETPLIEDLSALRGKRMALPAGTAIFERISTEFPNIKLIGTASEDEAIGLVADKQADMTLRSLIVAAYTIKKNGWFNLKINSQLPGYENNLRIGVVKSEPLLRDLLNKGIATLSDQEKNRIIDRHIEIKMVTDIDYTPLKWLVGLTATILLTSLYWLRRLRKINQSLAAALDEVQTTEMEQRQFISMLSHEIRSPLAVIDTTAQLLSLKPRSQAEIRPLEARIRRGANRLTSLLDNSLTQDRLNSKNFTLHSDDIDLSKLLSVTLDNAELFSRQNEISATLDDTLTNLHGDQTLLRILLNNLITNAIKYTPAGTPIHVGIAREGDVCLIQVADRGPGIPPGDLPHIFERFHRGKNVKDNPGAGLGLSLVARIVKLHGGTISVDCPPGGGTTFSIRLPLPPPDQG